MLSLYLRLQATRKSLPTRGGWIEISPLKVGDEIGIVPPHTGRVD